MPKKLSAWQLGTSFAGCFLGAGYMSGQELWQFFGIFGASWGKGLVLTLCMIFIFGCLFLRLMFATNCDNTVEIVFGANHIWLKKGLNILMPLFLYAVIIVMASGIGALAEQMWGMSAKITAVLFCFLCAAAALSGAKGAAGVFTFIVPVLAIAAVGVSLLIFKLPAQEISVRGNFNPLLPNWQVGAILFAAHNIFGALGMLAPFQPMLQKGTLVRAAAIGTAVLGAIAFFELQALARVPIAAQKELPMLYLAAYLGDGWGGVYAALLFSAMSASALGAMVALKECVRKKWPHKYLSVVILAIFTAFGSILSFSGLIGVIYPLCGYAGIVLLVGIAEHSLRIFRKNENVDF